MGSKARNFRRRVDDDDGDDESSAKPSISGPPPSSSAKPKKPPPRKPKLLSFADDEGDTEGPDRPSKSDRDGKPKSLSRLNKSSVSAHKITSSKDRLPAAPAPTLPSNVQPQAGEYTAEKLRELQKNTRTLASSKPAEPVVVLKGLIKPVPPPVPDAEEDGERADEKGGASFDIKAERDDAEQRLSNMGIGKGSVDDSSGPHIPDQATINAIRAKRERLRQSRAAPDYISLDSGGGGLLSDDDGDFHGRISLVGDKPSQEAKGVFESIDVRPVGSVDGRLNGKFQVTEEDEEAEEENRWEEEQFRKGLGKRVDDASNVGNGSVVAAPSFMGAQSVQLRQGLGHLGSSESIGVVGVARAIEPMSIVQMAEVASRDFDENIRLHRDLHKKKESSLLAIGERLKESGSKIVDLEKAKSDAEAKYIFVQKMAHFVTVICELLEEKAPFIEELEEQKQKLHQERALAITERRAADMQDEMVEVEAAVNAAKSVLSRGSSEAAAMAAKAAIDAAREHSNLPIEYDEFGRDKSGEKQSRARSRQRRRARCESKRKQATTSGSQPIEGELSTDESDSESYSSSRSELLEAAESVFRNAADEYSDLSLVKKRFTDFKKFYLTSYRDAYMSMSVPMIFSYYVRLELLQWDPLHEVVDFYDMQWHSLLFDYGLLEDDSRHSTNDPDWNLVPRLVEKVAIPILQHDIVHCWDVLSTRATRSAVSAINMVINYVPDTSSVSDLQKLFAAVRSRLADAVDNLYVPTWDTKVIKAVPEAARTAAYQFGVSVRLLKNICLWREILSRQVLEELALDGLLLRKVLPHLRNLVPHIHDSISRTERIIVSMSDVWPGTSVKGDSSSKLQPLVEYVMRLMIELNNKHQMGGVGEDETRGLARRLKSMLVQLNEYDKAKTILKTFNLKEAI